MDAPSTITLAGDSRCTISATECMTNTLAPYFCNRVGEVLDDHIEKWKKRDPAIEVEEIQFVPGLENPADIATRGEATYEDVSFNGTWQCGPPWLKLPRNQWSMNRDFIMRIPESEKRLKVFTLQQVPTTQPSTENKKTKKSRKLKEQDWNKSCFTPTASQRFGVSWREF